MKDQATFDVDVFFTGLFGVVVDDGEKPSKMALVVPNADSENPKCDDTAADDEPLYRHRWFVEFDANQLTDPPGGIPPNTRSIWSLSDCGPYRRLTFNTQGDSNDFDPKQTLNALQYVSDLTAVAPEFSTLPKKALSWKPGKKIAGQIMFDRGSLIEPESCERQDWNFPPTLSNDSATSGELSHKIHLHLSNLTQFEIESRADKDDAGNVLSLQGEPNTPITVTICCLCDMNPLRWQDNRGPVIDDDFRWFYELISDQTGLKDKLKGRHLPVPHPDYPLNGQGQNCLATQFQPQSFTID